MARYNRQKVNRYPLRHMQDRQRLQLQAAARKSMSAMESPIPTEPRICDVVNDWIRTKLPPFCYNVLDITSNSRTARISPRASTVDKTNRTTLILVYSDTHLTMSKMDYGHFVLDQRGEDVRIEYCDPRLFEIIEREIMLVYNQ